MTTLLRVTSALVRQLREDLSRPHDFAVERVSWLTVRSVRVKASEWLALATGIRPIADELYIRDDRVGARIGAEAIRQGLQIAIDEHCGVFLAHSHEPWTEAWFSNVDLETLWSLAPPFRVVSPENVHGGIVLGSEVSGVVAWEGDADFPVVGELSIVGHPLRFRTRSHGRLHPE